MILNGRHADQHSLVMPKISDAIEDSTGQCKKDKRIRKRIRTRPCPEIRSDRQTDGHRSKQVMVNLEM